MTTSAPAKTDAGIDHGSLRAEIGKVGAEIEQVDGVLLDTLGGRGALLTGGLVGAGTGLAVADIPGAIVGFAVCIAIGLLGTRGRHSRS